MRRSACRPEVKRTLALVPPLAVTSWILGCWTNHSTIEPPSRAATMKSRSPIVSSRRRRAPGRFRADDPRQGLQSRQDDLGDLPGVPPEMPSSVGFAGS